MEKVNLKKLKQLLKKNDEYFPDVTVDTDDFLFQRITTIYLDDIISFNFLEEIKPNGLLDIKITLYNVKSEKEYDIKQALKEFSKEQYYLLVGILTGAEESQRLKELKEQVFSIYLLLSGETND